ncbi:hypothetical protein H072_2434 [Dactylellina haptotyla CBS 200.50]|uniref:Uncharacterized protein n=1 Tax=Dactylellina haptotyla (strain CBS 200.50) TaxID=1284197 RepID=S8AL18_DACHA|nr:hypothetical protein H072_2434 [Dactylellina haptotyla CBS 200.50]
MPVLIKGRLGKSPVAGSITTRSKKRTKLAEDETSVQSGGKGNSSTSYGWRGPKPSRSLRNITPSKPWPVGLAAKVDAESKRLQKERFKTERYIEVPVTSLSLKNFPVETVVIKDSNLFGGDHKVYNEGETGAKNREAGVAGARFMHEVLKSESKSWAQRWGRGIQDRIYAWKQAMVWISYNIWWILLLGQIDYQRPGLWKHWAYRYPPVPGGYDFFNIRNQLEDTRHNGQAIHANQGVYFNPEPDRHEADECTNFGDKNKLYGRHHGGIGAIDRAENGNYQCLTPQDDTVERMGEQVVKPLMTLFKAVLAVRVLSWIGMVLISVGHMYIAEFWTWATGIELDENMRNAVV